MRKYKINKNFFKVIDTEVKAYWLGFLYADGCILEYKNKKTRKLKGMVLELGLSYTDKSHIQEFLNAIESEAPIGDRKIKLGGKTHKASRVSVCCTEICRDLIKLGCTPRKSNTLSFPSEDILPVELRNHFIRGYFDGDGCVSFYKNTRKTSDYGIYGYKVGFVGTKAMLDSITFILKNKAGLPLVKYQSTGKAKQFTYSGFKNMMRFHDYIYNNATIFLKRKKEVFDNTLKERIAVYGRDAIDY